MGNPRFTTPKSIRKAKAKIIMEGKNMSLKEKIISQFDNVKLEIDKLEDKKKLVRTDIRYTEEYKKESIKNIEKNIKELESELTEFIKAAAKKELQVEEAKNTNTDIETSNILKMLDTTRDTMTEDRLQDIYNNNINDPLITETIYSIAESKNININRPVNEKEILEKKVDKLINTIGNQGADSLGVAISLQLL